MRRRAAVLAALLVLGNGCGVGQASSTPPTPASSVSMNPTPTPTPSVEAGRTLKALQASVARLGAVEVSGVTVGQAELGRRRGTADLLTGEFRASLGLGNGQVLEMLRQADLTWTRAPASYWVRLGYTRASAEAARGKWVVANATEVKDLVGALDPGVLVTSLLALEPDQAASVGPVVHGDLRGNQVLGFHQAGADQQVYVTPGPRPRLLRLASTKSGVTTTIDFTARNKPFRVRLPEANQVFQP